MATLTDTSQEDFASITSPENYSKSSKDPFNRGGMLQRHGQVAGGAATGAVKGAVKGAAKEGVKQGAKYAVKGAQNGAKVGAKLGSVVPVAGTAIGGAIGGVLGGVGGFGLGVTKGAAQGGAKGAVKGAKEGAANAKAKQQQQGKKGSHLPGITNLAKKLGKNAIPGLNVADQLNKNKNKIVIAIIVIIIFFFFLVFFLVGSGQLNPPATQTTTTNPLQVSVYCIPAEITVGQTSLCTVSVTDSASADDIAIVVTIYPFAQYVTGSASNNGIYNATQDTVTWDAKKLNVPLTAPITLPPLSLTVTKTANEQGVPIVVTANATGGGTAGVGSVPANNSTCGGKYTLNTQYENFGDPQCNFTQQALGTLLSQLDSANALTWNCIAEHESAYNPNAYLNASTSGLGAYGLFQMNPKGQGNGQYDAGNVNWTLQTSNAINYRNKVINGSWAYWETYTQYCSNVQ